MSTAIRHFCNKFQGILATAAYQRGRQTTRYFDSSEDDVLTLISSLKTCAGCFLNSFVLVTGAQVFSMLTPAFANFLTFFYAVGNTPAVSLTQNVPPGQHVDVLSLGCGDLRNILFSIHTNCKLSPA